MEGEVRRSGFHVVRELCGHGVSRTIHEPPMVLNYCEPLARQRLTEGLVITVEPIADGWTVCTSDGARSAHFEHTLAITHAEPIILTA